MTDAEWQTCADPRMMLIDPRTEISGHRKVGLFGIACLRTHELIAVFEDWRAATDAAEATLDQSADIPPPGRYHRNWSPPFATRQIEFAVLQILYGGILRRPPLTYGDLVRRVSDGAWRIAVAHAIQTSGGSPPAFGPDDEFHPVFTPAVEDVRARQATLLRDIVPHPLQAAEFNPRWRTEAAVALARGMHYSRDFAAMPVLADALDDAGCDQGDILNHCRNGGPHVGGCWVVDLVLGKT